MPTYFLTKYCVLCICGPQISKFSPQDTARLYNIFYRLSPTVSCLNHILGFSPKGVSIPSCFTHLHTYFSCHATVSLDLDVVLFYLAHHRTPNIVSINHVLTTYIEHQHSVDLPWSNTKHSVNPNYALTPDST